MQGDRGASAPSVGADLVTERATVGSTEPAQRPGCRLGGGRYATRSRVRSPGLEPLREDVAAMIERTNPDLLLVFDECGVTGHPDHVRATEAALDAARSAHLPVVA